MIPSTVLTKSVVAGVRYLGTHQLASGEFQTLASSHADLRNGRYESSPFVTSHVASSLRLVAEADACAMAERSLDFLASEMEGPGLWRFWASSSRRHAFLPPDADDVACASYVLRSRRTVELRNEEFLLESRRSDGLFFTWMFPRTSDQWRRWQTRGYFVEPNALTRLRVLGDADNTDCVVNANVLAYLGDRAETASVVPFLFRILKRGEEDDHRTYYTGRIALYHAISRCHRSDVRSVQRLVPMVADRTVQLIRSRPKCALDLALGLCTMLNLGAGQADETESAICALVAAQQPDGSWPGSSMFLGPAPHYGSAELTTGFCIEALSRYSRI